MNVAEGPKLLLTPSELKALLETGSAVAFDCRFDLADPARGEQLFLAGHIPGAAYAHLDRDLSSPVTPRSGRHPLPEPQEFANYLARNGWSPGRLLVAYDADTNAFASRLWWLMRYFGQDSALLDGGLACWKAAGYSLQPGCFGGVVADPVELVSNDSRVVSAEELLDQGAGPLLDARAPERFRGAVEPLDTRGGHIPGARNRPLGKNLTVDARFKPAFELQSEYAELLAGADASEVVHYCGSGVTACHNAFAMELAGLGATRIYPGSWSEWIRDPLRPIATGN